MLPPFLFQSPPSIPKASPQVPRLRVNLQSTGHHVDAQVAVTTIPHSTLLAHTAGATANHTTTRGRVVSGYTRNLTRPIRPLGMSLR